MPHDSDATRGVVLSLHDLTWPDWPERLAAAGLNTIGLHPWPTVDPQPVVDFVRSAAGETFLGRCHALGLRIEYESHAMAALLPRALFDSWPELFRMNEAGQRTSDHNLCVSHPDALAIVAENAVALCRDLRPDTGRYFLWGDDGRAWCRCQRCRELSESEQALVVEHILLDALRADDPRATVAHLAYLGTLAPPKQLTPRNGIFLEFAPIQRTYDRPFADQFGNDSLATLEANLAVFGTAGAQVLEYWLDVSRFSKWQKPAIALPWNPVVCAADVAAYRARGIRHLTSFACFIDADYAERVGEPPLAEYGAALAG